jgi:hypothetical protein
MCTGGVFWLGNEAGHQRCMKKVFPAEYREAEMHGIEYRHLYGMLKDTKSPAQIVSALVPDVSGIARALGLDSSSADIDQRLDHACRAVLESRALDSA